MGEWWYNSTILFVMGMPAIVVNEKIVSMGKVLKASDVEKLLHKLGY